MTLVNFSLNSMTFPEIPENFKIPDFSMTVATLIVGFQILLFCNTESQAFSLKWKKNCDKLVTFEGSKSPAGMMSAMYGDLGMSSSLQRMCTAYSPGTVGQYVISAEPSPLSLQSILAWLGPSIEKPTKKGQVH